ncbi:hypothetical protein HanRHA438_Chr17g0834271 [Helianthus annuus]|nr:hypothetical protein HanRHA438_Chr17g0834271 [Helianthus annuus]
MRHASDNRPCSFSWIFPNLTRTLLTRNRNATKVEDDDAMKRSSVDA